MGHWVARGGRRTRPPDFALRSGAPPIPNRPIGAVLRGAKAGELPFEQPTRFYLTINRKTAGALGLAIPQDLMLRADKVIE